MIDVNYYQQLAKNIKQFNRDHKKREFLCARKYPGEYANNRAKEEIFELNGRYIGP